MITGAGREAVTASMKLQAFILHSNRRKTKKIFLQVHILLFSAKWGKEEEKLALLFPNTGKAFCFQCKLFSPEDSAFSRSGFCDWKNATQRMVAQESSGAHRDATMTLCRRGFCDWKNATQRMVAQESNSAHRDATMTLCRRAKASGRVNSLLMTSAKRAHLC